MQQERRSACRTRTLLGLTMAIVLTVGCTKSADSQAPPTDPSATDGRAATGVQGAVESSASKDAADRPGNQSLTSEDPSSVAEKKATKAGPAEGASNHHEALFKDWPQPEFVLLITGQQMGYLEPCGCTGLTNQKGGLSRRHTLARQLTQRGWPVVAFDVGNQVGRAGRQAEVKFQVTVEALKKIGYQAIAFGVDDLRLSVAELAAATLASEGGKTPYVGANVAVIDRALTPTHQIIEAGGRKIGITAVLGNDLQRKIMGSDIVLTSPEAGLDAVLPELRKANCDLLILLAHASIAESQQLAQKYRDFHVIVTAGGIGDPTLQPEPIPGTTAVMVQVGLKGMFVGVLGYYGDAGAPWRFQRVPLDDRFPDSPEMLAVLAGYQEQLKTMGFDELGLKPLPHPSGWEFVGSETCGGCHSKAYATWKDTPHFHATESLVHPPERGEIARHYDPECLSCHVTGWNPQKFFPYSSGYLSLDKTPLRTGNGCENCHGPGSAHAAAESGEGNPTPEKLKELQAAMRLTLANAEKKCIECHDLDNSPDFHEAGAFEKYWKQVEHKGLD